MTNQIPNQQLLLVDTNDKFSGKYADRASCHTGDGLHHRAFVVVLFNKHDQILLQKRKHMLWDGYWDVSAISHPLHLENHDESYEEAGKRALQDEVGIHDVKLKKIGGFNYFARERDYCENEYCAVLTGTYDKEVTPNPDAVYEYVWKDVKQFLTECEHHLLAYTPWALYTAEILKKK